MKFIGNDNNKTGKRQEKQKKTSQEDFWSDQHFTSVCMAYKITTKHENRRNVNFQ